MHRTHGFQCPLDIRQVLVWFLCIFPFLVFYFLCFPVLTGEIRSFLHYLFLFFYLAGIIMFFIATSTNHRFPSQFDINQGVYCRFCQVFVHPNAKHCRSCNRCRMDFDHHCKYINNCVTSENYSYFFYGTMSLIVSSVTCIVAVVYLGKSYKSDPIGVINILQQRYKRTITSSLFWVLYGASVLINLGLLVPLLILLVFHVFFQKRGITTYNFLMEEVSKEPLNSINILCISSGPQIHQV